MDKTLMQQLEFLKIADELKSVYRATVLVNQSRQENVAEHSWHTALMAMTLFEHAEVEGISLPRVLKMILVHDLVEIYAGDTPAFAGVNPEEKAKQEQESADKLFATLPAHQAQEYRRLWEEFDRMDTPDSLYAGALDRFSSFLANHLTDGHSWNKYQVTTNLVYKRIEPVKEIMPKLWEFVEMAIRQGVEKGYIKEGIQNES